MLLSRFLIIQQILGKIFKCISQEQCIAAKIVQVIIAGNSVEISRGLLNGQVTFLYPSSMEKLLKGLPVTFFFYLYVLASGHGKKKITCVPNAVYLEECDSCIFFLEVCLQKQLLGLHIAILLSERRGYSQLKRNKKKSKSSLLLKTLYVTRINFDSNS